MTIRNKDNEHVCSICEKKSNHYIWRKLKNGEHHYVCKECEDTIPC